jgi:hypothetical protein
MMQTPWRGGFSVIKEYSGRTDAPSRGGYLYRFPFWMVWFAKGIYFLFGYKRVDTGEYAPHKPYRCQDIATARIMTVKTTPSWSARLRPRTS